MRIWMTGCALGLAVSFAGSSLALAQDTADRARVSRRTPLRIDVTPSARLYRQCTDWHVIEHRVSGTTVLQHEYAAPSGFKLSATGNVATLSFQPIGVGATPATLTVCRATPTVGAEERVVTIDATGRAWVQITRNGACS